MIIKEATICLYEEDESNLKNRAAIVAAVKAVYQEEEDDRPNGPKKRYFRYG